MKKLLKIFKTTLLSPFRLIKWIYNLIAKVFGHIWNGLKSFFIEEPENSPLADVIQTSVANPGVILEHLNDFRKHIFRSVLAILLATAISFTYISEILDWIAQPVGGLEMLQAIDITEPVGVVMRTALLVGFALALPYVLFELMLFAAPGLSRKARFIGIFSIPLVSLFFIGGGIFSYYFLVPPATEVLINFMGISTIPRPSSYIKFTTTLIFWIGIAFEFPLITFILSSMRLIKPKLLLKNWRMAIAIISVVAAMVTPTVDPVNMLIVMIPLIALYFFGTFMAFLAQGWKNKE
jgi:sec-independent protein translocase protein TatC